jgi:hypothetical protein
MTAHTWLHGIGVFLTIAGILTTALGVYLTRRRFTRRPGLWGAVRQGAKWVGTHLHRNSEPVTISASGTVGVNVDMTGEGFVTPGSTITIDEKVEWLVGEIVAIRGQLIRVRNDIKSEGNQRLADDNAEIMIRERQIEAVHGRIEGLAGDLLWVSAIGVCLLIAGQLLTAF